MSLLEVEEQSQIGADDDDTHGNVAGASSGVAPAAASPGLAVPKALPKRAAGKRRAGAIRFAFPPRRGFARFCPKLTKSAGQLPWPRTK